jgi:PKD repeat protein
MPARRNPSRRARLTVLGIASAVAALGALPAGASAQTYCISAPACNGTPTTLQTALDSAGGSAADDRIEIGAGTFVGTSSAHAGFVYQPPAPGSGTLDVVGAGAAQTILSGPTAGTDQTFVTLMTTAPVTISNLKITNAPKVGKNVYPGHTGLQLVGGTASHIVVAPAPAAAGTYSGGTTGVSLEGAGATVTDSTLSTDPDLGGSSPIDIRGTGDVVRDVRASGAYGIYSNINSSAVVRRVSFTAAKPVYGYGHLDVDEALLHVTDPTGTGVTALTSNLAAEGGSLRVSHATIVGPMSRGVQASSTYAGREADVVLAGSIVDGAKQSLTADATAGAASVSVTGSDFDPETIGHTGNAAVTVGQGNMDITPHFMSTTDFRLSPDSPLIDAGSAAGLAPGDSATDAGGQPRIVAAKQCPARIDVGAYEFQAPPIVVAKASADTVVAGTPVSFTAAGSCALSPEQLTYTWTFDDGAKASGMTIGHGWAKAGTRTVTLTVSNGHGGTASKTVAVVVTPAPGDHNPPHTGPPTSGSAKLTTLAKKTGVSIRTGLGSLTATCTNLKVDRCTVALTLKAKISRKAHAKSVKVGTVAGTLKGGAHGALKVKLTKAARDALKRRGSLKATVSGTSRNAKGAAIKVSGTLTLKKRK